jgi:hypothetical protein
MKRAPSKKSTERRKKVRGKASSIREKSAAPKSKELCQNCSKDLTGFDKALFVEEEIGRMFCSEGCIAGYFSPEIERLEKEYFRKLSASDLSGEEREALAHLRWITLQEPDEVWREKTLSGDFRFTLISEFQPEDKRVWCVCICLFLRGEPSFLYLAFPTRNAAMVNHYRKGERVRLVKSDHEKSKRKPKEIEEEEIPTSAVDGLADAWTEDETIRAQLRQERSTDDIGVDEFSLYQSCMEETLEIPDEVWSLSMKGKDALHLYHFIRYYPNETPGVWYIVVARETEDEEQIEILDAFPTRDAHLVDRYRRGEQEVGVLDTRASASRVVH